MKRFYSRSKLKEIELKWRGNIDGNVKENNIFTYSTLNNSKTTAKPHNNFNYVLSMFPYPSGNLHMGHVRVYSISDCLVRFHRLQSPQTFVLHPMGWDAFGLPAENAAISAKIQPSSWTDTNITQMRAQLNDLGYNFAWKNELKTCDPKYYKWTQWLFLKMYEKGWAYRAEAPVSWDPIDKTVLAAEQVDANGKSWRSGALVENKMLAQWYWKITDFADDLLNGLDDLEWPDAVKEMQRNWIGKIDGALINFIVDETTFIKGK
jgi:leucyl-tRNA synthetase